MPVVRVCDFETRSRLDLGSTNIYKYAKHSSTEVLVLSYAIDGGEKQRWYPGDPFPFEKYWPDYSFPAFNGEFELVIWKYICTRRFDWPELDPAQIDCLQARSAYAGLPRSLGDAADALGMANIGKDGEGHKNMMKLCKPQKVKGSPVKLVGCEYYGGEFDNTPSRHLRNYEYCDQDVAAEEMVHRITPSLPASEKELWLVHQRINERGIPIDVDLCHNAALLVEREKKKLCRQLMDVTDFLVKTPDCHAAMKLWARRKGYPFHATDEECVRAALQLPDLDPKVREALTIRMLYRDSAVSKYQGMLNHAESDGRARAAHVYYQAGPGRFAGAGVNFLNLRRIMEWELDENIQWAERISAAGDSDLDEIYEALRATEKIDERGVISGGVVPMLGRMVRMGVRARPRFKLVDCDFKSIEYRKLHWLAGDELELKRIRDFDQGVGLEPYVLGAASIFQKDAKDVTKAERQIGKVQRLGAGYLAGATTFAAFCANYGIDMDLERANEIVQHYRRENPLVKKFWYDAGRCAVKAVETGRRITLRHIEFYMEGCTLNVRLPSGRLMKYYDAKVVDGMFGPEIEALDQRSGMRKAVGLPILIENIDQASSRDLLAVALKKCDKYNLPVVLHVYDSIMCEVPEDDEQTLKDMAEIMCESPEWCLDLPLSYDAKVSTRMT